LIYAHTSKFAGRPMLAATFCNYW